tara:strand:+ start:491 stop:688 length:198 start_codon:yes stop_codon:yes gene_type:complete
MRQQLVQPLPEDIATRINLVRDIVIDLTDSLNTQEDCWDAWKKVNKSLNYLSAKQTMLEIQEGGD